MRNNEDYHIDLVQYRQKLKQYNTLKKELAQRVLEVDEPEDDDVIDDIKEQMRALNI
jgi:hypothetical protein